MNERQLLWNRYSMHIDAYHKYMDIVVKLNLFYYGITGAILSFYFSKAEVGSAYVKLSLLLPVLFSLALIFLFGYAIKALAVSKIDIINIVRELEMNAFVAIDALIYMLWGSISFVVLVSFGILYVLFFSCI